jgi:hypothetical protein
MLVLVFLPTQTDVKDIVEKPGGGFKLPTRLAGRIVAGGR